VQRETLGFRILQQTGDDGAPPAIGDLRTTSMFATSISSVQNSGRSLICCLKAMFTGRLTKSYGQRELPVLAPINLLAFGQAIAK
jgi:hypothetical protein